MITTLRNVFMCALFAMTVAACGGGSSGSSTTPNNAGGGGNTNTSTGGGSSPPTGGGSPPANCSSDVTTASNSAPNASAVKTLLTNTVWSNNLKCIDCHGGNGNLMFTTGDDWAKELVNVDSFEQPSIKRVKPGDAANSYLIQKLEGAPTITGARMPRGADPLSTDQINQIKAWINGIALCP